MENHFKFMIASLFLIITFFPIFASDWAVWGYDEYNTRYSPDTAVYDNSTNSNTVGFVEVNIPDMDVYYNVLAIDDVVYSTSPWGGGYYLQGYNITSDVLIVNTTLAGGGNSIGTLAYANDTLFIGSWFWMRAYYLNGTQKWQANKAMRFFDVYQGNYTYIVGLGWSDQLLYVLNYSDGSQIWNTTFYVGEDYSDPIINGDIVYFATHNHLYAWNLTNGSHYWNDSASFAAYVPIIESNRVIVRNLQAATPRNVTAYHLNGTKNWTIDPGADIAGIGDYYKIGGFASLNDVIYFSNGKISAPSARYFNAINATDGTTIWQSASTVEDFGPAIILEDIIYSRSAHDVAAYNFYAYNITDQSTVFSQYAPRDVSTYYGSLASSDGTIFYGLTDYLYILGDVWRARPNANIYSSLDGTGYMGIYSQGPEDMTDLTVTPSFGSVSGSSINVENGTTELANFTFSSESTAGVVGPISITGSHDNGTFSQSGMNVVYYNSSISSFIYYLNISDSQTNTTGSVVETFNFSNNGTATLDLTSVIIYLRDLTEAQCYDSGGTELYTVNETDYFSYNLGSLAVGAYNSSTCYYNFTGDISTEMSRIQDTSKTTTANITDGLAYSAIPLNLSIGDLDASVTVTYNYTKTAPSGWNITSFDGTETIALKDAVYVNLTSASYNSIITMTPWTSCSAFTPEYMGYTTISYNCTARVYANDTINYTNIAANATFFGGTNLTTWTFTGVSAIAGSNNDTHTFNVTVPGINFTDNGLISSTPTSETYETLIENPNATLLDQNFVNTVYADFPYNYTAGTGFGQLDYRVDGVLQNGNVSYGPPSYSHVTGNVQAKQPSWSQHNVTFTVSGTSPGGGGGGSGGGPSIQYGLTCPEGTVWDSTLKKCVIPSVIKVEPSDLDSRTFNTEMGYIHEIVLTITNIGSEAPVNVEISSGENWILAEPKYLNDLKKDDPKEVILKFAPAYAEVIREGSADFYINDEYDFSLVYQQTVGAAAELKAQIALLFGFPYEEFLEYMGQQPFGVGPTLGFIIVAAFLFVAYLSYINTRPRRLNQAYFILILLGIALLLGWVVYPTLFSWI